MKSHLRPALVAFGVLTLVTGVAYPLVVTAVGQGLFPHADNGSLIPGGGSELIVQPFDGPAYFWGRPSATAPFADNAGSSTGSNLGPINPDALKAIADRVEAVRQAQPDQAGHVPADLVAASASGLDAHIGPAAAEYQVTRVAAARGVSADEVRKLVAARTEGRTLGVLGEPRVNVLLLDRDLDVQWTVEGR